MPQSEVGPNQSSALLQDSLGQIEEQPYINPAVAISAEILDTERDCTSFSFLVYEENKCELKDLDKVIAKKLTKALKAASAMTPMQLKQSIGSPRCTPVIKAQNYSGLFNNLPGDVELNEIHFSDTGRVFGHFIGNQFHIIAIKVRHIKY